MKTKKIVLTGGPGTGKTSLLKILEKNGYQCLHEISRQITLDAQRRGISQLFLKKPLLFSEMLLTGRIKQHKEAEQFDSEIIFIDRGIPDVVAYLDYFGNEYPPLFNEACRNHPYDLVFLLPPWKEIYVSDNERYESYDQAVSIHDHLEESYRRSGYDPIEVPKGTIKERFAFILDHLS